MVASQYLPCFYLGIPDSVGAPLHPESLSAVDAPVLVNVSLLRGSFVPTLTAQSRLTFQIRPYPTAQSLQPHAFSLCSFGFPTDIPPCARLKPKDEVVLLAKSRLFARL